MMDDAKRRKLNETFTNYSMFEASGNGLVSLMIFPF